MEISEAQLNILRDIKEKTKKYIENIPEGLGFDVLRRNIQNCADLPKAESISKKVLLQKDLHTGDSLLHLALKNDNTVAFNFLLNLIVSSKDLEELLKCKNIAGDTIFDIFMEKHREDIQGLRKLTKLGFRISDKHLKKNTFASLPKALRDYMFQSLNNFKEIKESLTENLWREILEKSSYYILRRGLLNEGANLAILKYLVEELKLDVNQLNASKESLLAEAIYENKAQSTEYLRNQAVELQVAKEDYWYWIDKILSRDLAWALEELHTKIHNIFEMPKPYPGRHKFHNVISSGAAACLKKLLELANEEQRKKILTGIVCDGKTFLELALEYELIHAVSGSNGNHNSINEKDDSRQVLVQEEEVPKPTSIDDTLKKLVPCMLKSVNSFQEIKEKTSENLWQELIKKYGGFMLNRAIFKKDDNLAMLKYLVEELKLDLNSMDEHGDSPLSIAITEKELESAEYLRKQGAVLYTADQHTVLYSAILDQDLAWALEDLYKIGENIFKHPAKKDYFSSDSMFIAAVCSNALKSCKKLLELANEEQREEMLLIDGNKALDLALKNRLFRMASFLIDQGVDPTIKNVDAKSAIDLIKEFPTESVNPDFLDFLDHLIGSGEGS